MTKNMNLPPGRDQNFFHVPSDNFFREASCEVLKTCPSTYVKSGMGIFLLASQKIFKVGKFSLISE